jgi:enoyl-CoA hydratase/carnithine racemase
MAAARVLKRSPRATELTKMLINAAEGEESERVVEALAGAVAAASGDLAEGLAAYRQKRSPRFDR